MDISKLVDHLCSTDSQYEIIKGRVNCPACNRFWLEVAPTLIIPSHDTRALYDFPYVNIPETWQHYIDRPIFEYCQREIYDLIEGIHWHVVCDCTFIAKDDRWRKECMELFELAMYRAVQLGMSENIPDVLDYDTFRIVTEFPGTDVKRVSPNYAYFHDIATLITEFLKEMFVDRDPVPMGPPVEYDFLRTKIVDNAARVTDADLVKFRRVYHEDLTVTPGLKQVHRRKNPLNNRPASRDVIVSKRSSVYQIHCESKEHILNCRRTTKQPGASIVDLISLDALFTRECVSQSARTCNPAAVLFRSGFPNIRYARTRALWVVRLNADDIGVGYRGLIEAFAYARTMNPTPKKGSDDISCFDSLLRSNSRASDTTPSESTRRHLSDGNDKSSPPLAHTVKSGEEDIYYPRYSTTTTTSR